ncbi:polyprenyl synthetase [Streptomyces sp. H27-D2]|uniref:polyprenyl synthetase n=1 Tax=Streptomyces sp. H27-D2 TaxID=3046304 RepID=UPI002DBD5710|nr:polyprenyl synthetase [Streptomyces sp. H27-D2]MEC4019428.1 polyprenyl synthetase [Streptomyces sp. H27-D2]
MSVGKSGSGSDRRSGSDLGTEAVYLAAGLADLALSGAGSVLRGLRGALGRSDLAELAQDGEDDLKVRGRLAVERYASVPEPHLELLAQRAAARLGARDASR